MDLSDHSPAHGPLTLGQAAARLGVTPELASAYARRAPKRPAAPDRRLPTLEGVGPARFDPRELDAFDAFLREPWSPSPKPRPPIPDAVSDYLKVEAGGACALCGGGDQFENAHIGPYADTLSHHHHNLIRVCRPCHGRFDAGLTSRETVEARKRALVTRLRASLAVGSTGGGPSDHACPRPSDLLVGRTDAVERLASMLGARRTILITGVGGIGKTQLLLHALALADVGRPVRWVGIEATRATGDIEQAVSAVATSLGARSPTDIGRALDHARACLVLDGVERLGDDFDGLGDLVAGLVASTSVAQIVVTSQVRLPAIRFEAIVEVKGLSPADASDLLRRGVGGRDAVVGPAFDRLAAFSDGHPLTLRIMAALLGHFGDAAAVERRIRELGAPALATPGRRRQDETTSLRLCLRLAFANLDGHERRLLWVLAQCPAGVFVEGFGWEALGIDDVDAAVAGARHWNLVAVDRGTGLTSAAMLSPVRAFCVDAFDREPPDDVDGLRLATAVAVSDRVALFDRMYLRAGHPRLGMSLLGRELPNALAAFEVAVGRVGDDGRYQRVTGSLAASLMIFLFSTGRFAAGAGLMRSAVEAAARWGRAVEALDDLAQLQSLASRAGDHGLERWALERAEGIVAGHGGRGLATLRSMQAHDAAMRGDHATAERRAAECHDLRVAEGRGGREAAMALFQRARALEGARRPAEALPLLEAALATFDAAGDPINTGSTLHHIGNCAASLGRDAQALRAYLEAARLFQDIAAVEFRSNALGEAGLLLVDFLPDEPVNDLVDPGLVGAGLDDVLQQCREVLDGAGPRFFERAMVVHRKFAGLLVLASLASADAELLDAADALYHDVLLPFVERHGLRERTSLDEHGVVAFLFDALARLSALVAERTAIAAPTRAAAQEEAITLARLAGEAFAGPLHPTMMRWVGNHLRRGRGMTWVTDAEIAEAAAPR